MTLSQVNLPPNQDLEETVLQLVAVTLDKKPGQIKPDAPLFSSQEGFNSFALMEFVLRLEDTFGLSIPDEDLDPDIFYSVQTIASYLRVRLEQRG
jgi:acyl carrier protein